MVSWKQKVVKYICEDIPPICLSVLMLSCVWFFTTPWTVACQAPLPMGFSQQEYWSRLPFPPPGDLSDPEIKLASLASPVLPEDALPLSHWGSLIKRWTWNKPQRASPARVWTTRFFILLLPLSVPVLGFAPAKEPRVMTQQKSQEYLEHKAGEGNGIPL